MYQCCRHASLWTTRSVKEARERGGEREQERRESGREEGESEEEGVREEGKVGGRKERGKRKRVR